MNIENHSPGTVFIPSPHMIKTRQKQKAECHECADYGYVPTKDGQLVKCEVCNND